MIRPAVTTLAIAGLAVVSCKRETKEQAAAPSADGVLLRVGAVTVTEEDVLYQLREKHAGRTDDASRRLALDELEDRARMTRAALDAGMGDDPITRAEIARILIARLRETELDPKLRAVASAEIPEARLREIYQERNGEFRSEEKRQVAVLWLDPGGDPERAAKYGGTLAKAREWFLANNDLVKNPAQGFSVLSVDHSEHAASRFSNGVLGWFGREGGADPLGKAAAEIVFSLEKPGDVSDVITRPEGVFLVRCMAVQPAFVRSFESVSGELEQAERNRLRAAAEAEFHSLIQSRYPTSPLAPEASRSQLATSP